MKNSEKETLFVLLAINGPALFLTIIMITQWDTQKSFLMGVVLAIIWLGAIILSIISLKEEASEKGYGGWYLVDYETLAKYMKEEIQSSYENNIKCAFYFYLYQNDTRLELKCYRNYVDTELKEEFYCNNVEYSSLYKLLEEGVKRFDGYVLVETLAYPNPVLDDFKQAHQELDVATYVKNLKSK